MFVNPFVYCVSRLLVGRELDEVESRENVVPSLVFICYIVDRLTSDAHGFRFCPRSKFRTSFNC